MDMDTKEKLQEISDKGYIQDIVEENERRIKRGEKPIDIERTKVWYYAQGNIDYKNLPKVSPLVKGSKENIKASNATASTLLKLLQEKNWPIDRDHVGKVMTILESELK